MTTGTLTNRGQHDWLAVQLTAGQAYEFTLTGLSSFEHLEVASGPVLDQGLVAFGATPSTAPADGVNDAFFRPDSSGTYYVDISDLGGSGTYTAAAAAVTTDYTNNTATTGILAVGGQVSGTLTNIGQHDWLAVQLTAGQAYEFTLTGLSSFKQLEVSNAQVLDEGLVAFGTTPSTGSAGGTNNVFFRPDISGTFYVDVSNPGGTGAYTVAAAAVTTDYANTTATTGALAVGGQASGNLSNIGQHDWLAVQLTAGQAYEFTLTGLSSFKQLEVSNAQVLDEGLVAFGTTPSTGSAGGTNNVFFRPDTSGTFYVDVSNPGGTGAYTVAAAAVTTDYTNTTATTGALAVGGQARGNLGNIGQHDWLAVQLTAGQAYEFTLTGLSAFEQLEVASASVLDEGLVSFGAMPGTGPAGGAKDAFFRPDTSGTYYVDISDPGGNGAYSAAAAAVTTDYTNNTATTGVLTVGGQASGNLTNIGQHDWLAVQLTAGQAYEFTLTGLSAFEQLEVASASVLDEGLVAFGATPSVGPAGGVNSAFFRPDTSGTYYVDVSDPGSTGAYAVTAAAVATDYTNNAATIGALTPACYCPGTLILTELGERPVEELAIGDCVITRSGKPEPIKWIGRRSYFGRFLAAHPQVSPIRIHAGALGEGLPRRDLLLSPCHALLIDGVLVPAGALVNGVSVTHRELAPVVSYIHLELNDHDAIWAEGVLAETFVDDDSRGIFHNAHDYPARFPDEPWRPACYCARRLDDGFEVEAIRRRIAYRAGFGRLAVGAG